MVEGDVLGKWFGSVWAMVSFGAPPEVEPVARCYVSSSFLLDYFLVYLMFHFHLQPVSGQHDGNLMWQKSLSWIYPKSSAANVLVQKAFPSLAIKGNFIVSSAYLPHFFTYFCPRWKGFGLEGWGKEGHPANSSIRKGIYGIYQKIFFLWYTKNCKRWNSPQTRLEKI